MVFITENVGQVRKNRSPSLIKPMAIPATFPFRGTPASKRARVPEQTVLHRTGSVALKNFTYNANGIRELLKIWHNGHECAFSQKAMTDFCDGFANPSGPFRQRNKAENCNATKSAFFKTVKSIGIICSSSPVPSVTRSQNLRLTAGKIIPEPCARGSIANFATDLAECQ